jgi:lipoprotein-anchoring transpeptidase ErfK/SrfK
VVPEKLDFYAKPGFGADNPSLGQLSHYQLLQVLETRVVLGVTWRRYARDRWVDARYVGMAAQKPRPSSIGASEKWVGVSLSEQTVVCYEGDVAVFAALAATGLPGTPTVQGIFRTWHRLDAGRMSGPGYDIEDVTWTCYFYSGYSLHTAYWHDLFGSPRSHGCVNLSPHDAWWIYQWSASGGPNCPTVYVYWA